MKSEEIKESIRQLVNFKNQIQLSGGVSPASSLFEEMEFHQKLILRAFRLRNTISNLKILNYPALSFTYDKDYNLSSFYTQVPTDCSAQSRLKENCRLYLQSTKSVHLKSVDEQIHHIYAMLEEKSGMIKGQD